MPVLLHLLVQDHFALLVLISLALVQAWSWRRWKQETRSQLTEQSKRLTAAMQAVGGRNSAGQMDMKALPPELAQAFRVAFPDGEYDESLEPRFAFDPDRLVPRSFNARVDAAAPGMFTAIGIVGTFVGLIIAFSRLDFTNAARSIAPLIGGMTISFLNSLLGVVLSIRWTLSSRRARHTFDNSARDLLAAVEKQFKRPAYGTQVLRTLVALREEQHDARTDTIRELQALSASTQGASRDLLESLTPRLEASFRALVDLPFERLGESVENFRNTVSATADRSRATLESMDRAVESLRAAHDGLQQATSLAHETTSAFTGGVEALQSGAAETMAVVNETQHAAVTLHNAADEFAKIGDRNQQLAAALGETVVELRGTSGSISGAATEFSAGAARMEEAARHIQQIGRDAAEHSAEMVRTEITGAVSSMASALREFADRSVEAYGSSSARLIEALDARVTDLTDRLSAELQTLAQRLPDSASEITRAADVLRRQLEKAVRGLEQAVKGLDASTTQTLAARLEEYDRLVAQAVDRFSGTMLTWDGKLTELGNAGRDISGGIATMQRDAGAVLAGAHGAADAAAKAATDASRAVVSLEAAVLRLAQARDLSPSLPHGTKVPGAEIGGGGPSVIAEPLA